MLTRAGADVCHMHAVCTQSCTDRRGHGGRAIRIQVTTEYVTRAAVDMRVDCSKHGCFQAHVELRIGLHAHSNRQKLTLVRRPARAASALRTGVHRWVRNAIGRPFRRSLVRGATACGWLDVVIIALSAPTSDLQSLPAVADRSDWLGLACLSVVLIVT